MLDPSNHAIRRSYSVGAQSRSRSCAFGGRHLPWFRIYPCRSVSSVVEPRHGMSSAVRRVLYRALDHLADTRHAARQAGGDPLRAIAAGHAVRDLREIRASGVLRQPAANAGNVRSEPGRGLGAFDRAGTGDEAGILTKARSAPIHRTRPKILGASLAVILSPAKDPRG